MHAIEILMPNYMILYKINIVGIKNALVDV